MRRAGLVGLVGLLLAGCTPQAAAPKPELKPSAPAPEAPAPPPPASPSAALTTVDAGVAHEAIQRRQLRGERLADSPLVHPTAIEDPEALAPFHRALRALNRGARRRVRVAVYGSSFVAGDRFTGYLRGYLQIRFGDGGPGFVAAVPLWRWHRHQEVALDSAAAWSVDHALRPAAPEDGRYGLMGVRAIARSEGAQARVALRRELPPITEAELWFDGGPGRGQLELRLGDAEPVRVDTDRPRLEPGYARLRAPEGAARLDIRSRGGGPVHLFGVALERASPGVVVDELGIGGSGARRWPQWDAALWAEQLARREPALVILAYGGIESLRDEHDPDRFEAELEFILDQVAGAVPDAACLLIGPQDRAHKVGDGKRRERPASLDSIYAIERRVAARHGCAFFDLQALMGGPGTMPAWVEAGLARDDHVHFSPRGYAHVGRAFVDALLAE